MTERGHTDGKWYIYENDEVVGPFSVEELGDRLSKETLVCRAGSEEWNEAREVDDLQEVFAEDDSGLRMASSPTSSSAQETDQGASAEKSVSEGDRSQEGEQSEPIQESQDLQPTLDELLKICQHAENRELVREFKEHWDEYDRAEKRVIRNEMKSRGIFNETKNGDSEKAL